MEGFLIFRVNRPVLFGLAGWNIWNDFVMTNFCEFLHILNIKARMDGYSVLMLANTYFGFIISAYVDPNPQPGQHIKIKLVLEVSF